MARSLYFHSTLYRFNAAAAKTITARFSDTVRDASTTCWYDGERHVFCVQCSQNIGYEADQLIGNIIDEYVSEEQDVAEREMRPPHAVRFVESLIEDLDDLPALGLSQTTQTSPQKLSLQPQYHTTFTLHAVCIAAVSSCNVKVFKLRDISNGSNKILTSNLHAKKPISRGLSCRVVRFSNTSRDYVFNGRVGAPVNMEDIAPVALFKSANFDELTDQRHGAAKHSLTVNQRTLTAESAALREPLQQFVHQIREFEQEDPNKPAKIPEDAMNFLAHPTYQMQSHTRARVPRGNGAGAHIDSSDDEDSEDERSDVISTPLKSKTDFLNLIGGRVSHEVESEDEDEEESDTQTFNNVISKPASTAAPIPPSLPILYSKAGNATPQVDEQQSKTTSPSVTGTRSSFSKEHSFDQQENVTFPAYGKSYTKIDSFGLTSQALNTAKWENENSNSHSPKSNRSGIQRRSTMSRSSLATGTSSLAMTTSTRFSTTNTPSSSTRGSRTIRDSPRAWQNSPVSSQTPTGTLIDTSAQHTPSPVRPPPGLDLFRQSGNQAVIPVHGPSERTDGNLSDDLIDLSDVNEQKAPDQPAEVLRYTMSQKKPPRKKGKNNSNVPKVQLPKPELPPPPKKNEGSSRSSKSQTNTSNAQASKSVLEVKTGPANTHGASPPQEAAYQARTPNAIEKFLQDTEAARGPLEADTHLEIQFGLLFTMHPANKTYLDGVFTPEKFQEKLNSGRDVLLSEFFPRLTTEDKDAHYTFNLFEGRSDHAKCEYDIHIKDARGNSAVLRFDTAAKDSFSVLRSGTSTELATLYMHYPIHVWDAQVQIIRLDVDQELWEAAKEFVASISTAGDVPSFVAMKPTAAFSIECVYAKRRFSKTNDSGIELRLTEVRELTLQPLDIPGYNFAASVNHKETMIDTQQYWWQCSLVVDPVHVCFPVKIQEAVDLMVNGMDSVGFHNRGPFQDVEIEDNKTATEIPFW